MSVKAMTWAWQQQTATAGQKLVLLALADHAGEDFTCYPSTARLSEKTGYTVRTIRSLIDDLEADSFVIKAHRKRRRDGTLGTWVYRLNGQCHPDVTGAAEHDADDTDQCHPDVTGPVTSGNRTSDTRVSPPVTPQLRAEPSGEPSMNPPTVPVQLTREQLATAAGDQYARDEVTRGAQVRSPAGLARSKSRELLTKHSDRLDALIERDRQIRAAGLDPIPGSVLHAAALGDSHSLAHYPYPAQEQTA
ncbi:MAG: hypothetical protein CL424_07765 [Acidimicrobiaceae bacterium]|nr:hypothetical protein [Acidimicrobiaceae bacterium]